MNNVMLFGRLAADPEIAYTQGGTAYCRFTLAVNKMGKDEADFFRCVAFNKTAENLANMMRKGYQMALSGYLQVDKFTDKQTGQNRESYSIVANSLDFVLPPKTGDFVPQNNTPNNPPNNYANTPNNGGIGYNTSGFAGANSDPWQTMGKELEAHGEHLPF